MIEIIINHVGSKSRTGERTCIGKGMIENDGTGGKYYGNYDFIYGQPGKANDRQVKVRGFTRQKRTAWDLLYLALRQARGNRNR